MQGSVGQALRDARLEKKLTIDEVAHATHIRAARIADLEDDDYTHFPNIAYARSFLVLYAKFLGVDISKYPTVEVGSTVALSDYQYLRTEEQQPVPTYRARPELSGPPPKPRWLIVFFVFVFLAVLGAAAGWFIMNIQRLGLSTAERNKDTEVLSTPAPTPSPTPRETPPPTPSPTPIVPAAPPTALEPEIRRAEPVMPEPAAVAEPAVPVVPAVPAADASLFPPAGAEREVIIRATRKIRIRVEKDGQKTSSLYFGNINPNMRPLVFRGKSFRIRTAEPDALQVTVNGQPANGPESGVEIGSL